MFKEREKGRITILAISHVKANIFDLDLCEGLVQKLDELSARDSVIVLTGEGKIFSAGVDLRRMLTEGPSYVRRFVPALEAVLEKLAFYPNPVVAAVNGHAIAGGCILACAADYRVAVDNGARIGVPELRVGVPFPPVGMEIMRFAVAPERFQEVILMGRTYSMAEARNYGLVDEVQPRHEVLDRALAVAESLGSIPRETFAFTKAQIRSGVHERCRKATEELQQNALDLWCSPEILRVVERYVAEMLNKR
jgi:enoyl-CoA hydratase